MADISFRAEIGREDFSSVLQICDGQSDCLTSDRHPRALPQQLDNATADSLIGAAFTTPTYAIDRIHALLVFSGWVQ